MAHSSTTRRSRHAPAKRQQCSLYSSPAALSTLPVYEDITVTWDPACLTILPAKVDLFLSVQEPQGLTAVHVWTGIDYAMGKLDTQLSPAWWGDSIGAGSVSAQFTITPTGSPIWDTSAPAGPSFSIAYNGTYPASVTGSALLPASSGPSVESVSGAANGGVSGKVIGAAVAVPILVIAALVCAYVVWNRYKKKPEKKRWSAAIDNRMSMISQGTWQPRPSMSSRPLSHMSTSSHPRPSASFHRPSASLHRPSFNEQRPVSGYSTRASPLSSPVPLPEMRQVGSGDRTSRISFASGGPSPTRPLTAHLPASGSTKEDLAAVALSPPSPTRTRQTGRGHAHTTSVGSSLRQELASFPAVAYINRPISTHGAPTSPFLDPPPLPSPALSLRVPSPSHMPTAFRDSAMSPDQAFAAYAGTRSETPVGKGVVKSRSAKMLAAPGRMLRGLRGSASSASLVKKEEGLFADEGEKSVSSSEDEREVQK